MAQLPCIGLSWPLTKPPFGSCAIYFHHGVSFQSTSMCCHSYPRKPKKSHPASHWRQGTPPFHPHCIYFANFLQVDFNPLWFHFAWKPQNMFLQLPTKKNGTSFIPHFWKKTRHFMKNDPSKKSKKHHIIHVMRPF